MKRLFGIFIAVVLLYGCTELPNGPGNPLINTPFPATADPTFMVKDLHVTPSPAASFTPAMTRTSEPTGSISPTAIFTPISNGIENQCLNITGTAPNSTKVPDGILAFYEPPPNDKNSYLFNLQTGTQTFLSLEGKEEISSLAVSPDRKWLAYIISNRYLVDETILILNAEGKLQKRIDLAKSEEGAGIVQWLDNERLLLTYGEDIAIHAYSLILNASNGERQTLPSGNLPDVNNVSPPTFWGEYNLTRAVYDPSLTHVIYPSIKGSYTQDKKTYIQPIVLWDLKGKQTITEFYDKTGAIGSAPSWSPDGSHFVIDLPPAYNNASSKDLGRDIFLISKEGAARRLTSIKSKTWGLVDFSWSPDGKSIALWWMVNEDNEHHRYYQLVVLDIFTGKVMNYCVPAYTWNSNYPNDDPIWSPDGKYLVVAASSSNNPNDKNRISVLVAPSEGWAVKIAGNAIPIGWLESP